MSPFGPEGLSTNKFFSPFRTRVKRRILNLTRVQAGHKIQLIREVRELWGEEACAPGSKVAFYVDDDGRVTVEPVK